MEEVVQHVPVRCQIVPPVLVMDQHVPHVQRIIIDQQHQVVHYVQVYHDVYNVQQMQIDVRNVQQDHIQVELHVNHVQLFTPNVPDVPKPKRNVQHVPKDIMYPEEVVLNVQIR